MLEPRYNSVLLYLPLRHLLTGLSGIKEESKSLSGTYSGKGVPWKHSTFSLSGL